MSIVHRAAEHYCYPPDPFGTNSDYEDDFDPDNGPPPLKPGHRLPRIGDVWECDECRLTWKLGPPPRYGNAVSLTPKWEREGFFARQRRKWKTRH